MSEREYPVPDFPNYTVTESGELVSYWKERRILTGCKVKGRRSSGRIDIRHDLRKGDGTFFRKRIYQIVAAAKYGRWANPWELVRHLDGNSDNNSIHNLEIGDSINNSIDDYVYGSKVTTTEQLDLAIDRLMMLREKLEQEKSPSK